MLKKLEAMGIKLKWERVLEIAGEAAPGRPHVAEALVEAGHVANFRQAFARYLHNDGPAYVEGEHFPPEEAIKLIASAGGVSVLAHPWCCKNPLTLVPELAKLGIQGIEVYHDTNKIDVYGSLAEESGLLKMGGSDFHGIDPTTERAPGAIPFPRIHVDRFLAHALDVWERPLVQRLRAMAETVKLASPDAPGSEELLIWKEQEQLARRTLAELGMGVEIVTNDSAQVDGNQGSDAESHYRTIRVTTLGRDDLAKLTGKGLVFYKFGPEIAISKAVHTSAPYQFNVGATHLLEGVGLGYGVEVIQHERDTLVAQHCCIMQICGMEDAGGILNAQ
ncbi:hypothetical protein ON010_g15707 [Phytophthora cinnamomi]|nr:hypothetical protein ON010_g15707 [Phytophthora cinnamomi]